MLRSIGSIATALCIGFATLGASIAIPQSDPAATPTPGESVASSFDALLGTDLAAGDTSIAGNDVTSGDVVMATWFGTAEIDFDSTLLPVSTSRRKSRDAFAGPERNAFAESELVERQVTTAFSVFTTFKNSTTGQGYNITLPAGTCSTTPIGNYPDPISGQRLDGNIGSFLYSYTHAQKSDAEWRAWTRDRAQTIIDRFDAIASEPENTGTCHANLDRRESSGDDDSSELENPMAEPAPELSKRTDVALHSRMDGDQQGPISQRARFALGTGFWLTTFLATVPGLGATFGTLAGVLSAANDNKIGPIAEAALITAIGFITAVCSNILYRLESQALFGRFEIYLLNLFTQMAANVASQWTQCITASALRAAIQAYTNRFYNQPPSTPDAVVPPGGGGSPGAEVEMQNMC